MTAVPHRVSVSCIGVFDLGKAMWYLSTLVAVGPKLLCPYASIWLWLCPPMVCHVAMGSRSAQSAPRSLKRALPLAHAFERRVL